MTSVIFHVDRSSCIWPRVYSSCFCFRDRSSRASHSLHTLSIIRTLNQMMLVGNWMENLNTTQTLPGVQVQARRTGEYSWHSVARWLSEHKPCGNINTLSALTPYLRNIYNQGQTIFSSSAISGMVLMQCSRENDWHLTELTTVPPNCNQRPLTSGPKF